MNSATLLLDDLFASCLARYARILPGGIELPHHGKTLRSLPAQIRTWRPARTLYQNKLPQCRSLNAIHSITQDRACITCPMRRPCTPQIYIELLYDHIPYRLLLAYTSARNFLTFNAQLRRKDLALDTTPVLLSVRDRGRWGELCFSCAQPQPPA